MILAISCRSGAQTPRARPRELPDVEVGGEDHGQSLPVPRAGGILISHDLRILASRNISVLPEYRRTKDL